MKICVQKTQNKRGSSDRLILMELGQKVELLKITSML